MLQYGGGQFLRVGDEGAAGLMSLFRGNPPYAMSLAGGGAQALAWSGEGALATAAGASGGSGVNWGGLTNAVFSLYEPTARYIHDSYAQAVLGRDVAREYTVRTPWSYRNAGVRRYDGFDPETLTGFEANTTPWEQLGIMKYILKRTQIETDSYLLRSGSADVRRVIWFGTDALYGEKGEIIVQNPLARDLAFRLRRAGIPYYQVTP